jgi:predicted phosphodiesterase
MRIAVISDVHGNLLALEAVLTDVRARGPFDQVVNAGDLAFGGPRPAEVMQFLLDQSYPTILGNTDQWLSGAPGGPPAAVAWSQGQLSQRHLKFLRHLPLSHRVEPEGNPPLVIVHATPTSTTEMLEVDAPEDAVARIFEQARSTHVAYGHIHRAYIRNTAGGLIVNVGSVGFPFDGDPRPGWAIFSLQDGRWTAEILRVDYDREAVARDLLAGSHPDRDTFARRVRTARV